MITQLGMNICVLLSTYLFICGTALQQEDCQYCPPTSLRWQIGNQTKFDFVFLFFFFSQANATSAEAIVHEPYAKLMEFFMDTTPLVFLTTPFNYIVCSAVFLSTHMQYRVSIGRHSIKKEFQASNLSSSKRHTLDSEKEHKQV